jgi:hypothetical protein
MIDYSILYILCAIIAVLGLIFGISYLRTKNIVKADDINLVSSILNISMSIIQEMNLDQEKEILKIANIIDISLLNVINIIKLKEKEKVIEQAKIFAYQLCEKNNIMLNETRTNLIDQLITIVLNTKYGDMIVAE